MIDTTTTEERLFAVAKELTDKLDNSASVLLLQEYGLLFARLQLERVRRGLWDDGSYSASREIQKRIDALPGGTA